MRHPACKILLLSLLLTTRLSSIAHADVDYLTRIKPLLASKCYACHGVLKQEGGLRLETMALLLQGGDSGPAIQAGDAESSLLIHRISADTDTRMPPPEDGAALQPDEIRLLNQWIDEGAKAPHEQTPRGPRDHWAFQPVRSPELVDVRDFENPIDVLLHVKRNARSLKLHAPAPRSLLIRRLYLDLLGLPPTVLQSHDQRPWREIVDELLASPHHGERWARHWMDVWRYSDWYGLGAQLRYSQKHMWHWRDWIVNSLNKDKGYDRMVQEMLAGDEIAPSDVEAVTGTGFLARNYYLFNRTTWLDSTIEHTGKAFLGLTLNCAKCHDHKYDPITHVDYYNFRAFFEPHQVRLDPVPGTMDFEADGLPRVFDDDVTTPTRLHLKGNPQEPDQHTRIIPAVPALLSSFQPQIEAIQLPPSAFAPGTRDYVQQGLLEKCRADFQAAQQKWSEAKQKWSTSSARSDQAKLGSNSSSFVFADDFSAANPEIWEVVGDDWRYQKGTLQRHSSTRAREFVRLRNSLPEDFEVTCWYKTTGGATYKSITFRFDESADGQYANYVYTSAHEPRPKLQVAYCRNGHSNYPAEGRKAKSINVGDDLELKFAVRGQLVNVWLNGKFELAYALPDRRPSGSLTLQPFDATVAYDRIEIRALPTDVKLVAAKNAQTLSPATAQASLQIAAARLKSAEAALESLRSTLAADHARFVTERGAVSKLASQAARHQVEAKLAEAEYEQLVASGDTQKLTAATAKLQTARELLKAVEAGASQYESVKAAQKALEGPDKKADDAPAIYSDTSSGRRTSLARWITSPQNPLTARVAVNHVWMRHFGEPLVESVFDFGLRCQRPLHADVLDYLAADFMKHNWSFKRLHRLIVTSQTYQLSSSVLHADAATRDLDPKNEYYWRMNVRRMESQVVRDSLLHLAGTLDTKIGGPSVNIGNDSLRRSLYYKHSRDSQDKFLGMFDDADLLQCYRRSESIVPQQALALANSQVSMQNAALIAARITNSLESSDESRFVQAAIATVLSRPAADRELEYCIKFCQRLSEVLQDDAAVADDEIMDRVRTRLIHSLLNHNDFISIR